MEIILSRLRLAYKAKYPISFKMFVMNVDISLKKVTLIFTLINDSLDEYSFLLIMKVMR